MVIVNAYEGIEVILSVFDDNETLDDAVIVLSTDGPSNRGELYLAAIDKGFSSAELAQLVDAMSQGRVIRTNELRYLPLMVNVVDPEDLREKAHGSSWDKPFYRGVFNYMEYVLGNRGRRKEAEFRVFKNGGAML